MATECPYCGARFLDLRLFTRDEAARRIGVATSTIIRWIHNGELDARLWVRGKIGPVRYMIDSYDLEAFMMRHFPRRSELRSDHDNIIARRAYQALRFKKQPKLKNQPD